MGTPSNASVSQALAARYGLPPVLVERMLSNEFARLAQEARVTAYIPILAERRLEERLRAASRGPQSKALHPRTA